MAEERAQRRLAAILAADVVGYSRLMGQDEVGTLAVLKARRRGVLEPLVTKHQGRIFKITGDGVLVEFASAVNAVQCAVQLQQAFAAANDGQPEDQQIVLRIGVNLGNVMVEGSDLYGATASTLRCGWRPSPSPVVSLSPGQHMTMSGPRSRSTSTTSAARV